MKGKFGFSMAVMTTLALSLLFCSSALAEMDFSNVKVGVGYQGMFAGDFLHGVSARAWPTDRFAVEGNFFYGGIDVEVDTPYDDYGEDADLYAGEIKLFYAPIVRQYCKFYGGLQGSIGEIDLDGEIDYNDEIYGLGIFVGSEFHFQEIPELGFNFDVGYKHYFYDDEIDDTDIDLEIKGIGVTFGTHFYF
jgi:hypothetical protein